LHVSQWQIQKGIKSEKLFRTTLPFLSDLNVSNIEKKIELYKSNKIFYKNLEPLKRGFLPILYSLGPL